MSEFPTHIQTKIHALILSELEKMRLAGAGNDDLAEDVFKEMVARKVREQTLAELTSADERAVYKLFCETASPGELRGLAAVLRENNKDDSADDLERLARQREGT